ncbi:hypothetical protein [Halalkalibacter lacteus]|uniref:hypothetical protein n=1 Tax=Halalkalibacter lacteus TaxID=3090663 RepID=UPI002FC6BC55
MSLYDKFPSDFLVSFYYEILSNIDRGVLTERMHIELDLIHAAAKRKGIVLIVKKSS